VDEDMSAVPGSVAVQEGIIALSMGLPSFTGRRQKSRRANKGGNTKRG
jgi:hypothetical protein